MFNEIEKFGFVIIKINVCELYSFMFFKWILSVIFLVFSFRVNKGIWWDVVFLKCLLRFSCEFIECIDYVNNYIESLERFGCLYLFICKKWIDKF